MVTKQFGGLVAVSGVDFAIPVGAIVSLIGPNGAGKTTFFNVIAGLYRPTSGTVALDGRVISGEPPHRITRLGVARTFQNIRLFQNMSAIENVMVGHHSRMRATPFEAILRLPRERHEERDTRELCRDLLKYVGLEGRDDVTARTCPMATSAGSRWRARSPRSRSCCSSTSRRREWIRTRRPA